MPQGTTGLPANKRGIKTDALDKDIETLEAALKSAIDEEVPAVFRTPSGKGVLKAIGFEKAKRNKIARLNERLGELKLARFLNRNPAHRAEVAQVQKGAGGDISRQEALSQAFTNIRGRSGG